MRKVFVIFLCLLGITVFGQEIDEILTKRNLRTDSLKIELKKKYIESDDVKYLEDARETLKNVVENIINLEDFNNKSMQKALMKPLDRYYDAFNVKKGNEIINTLRFGFEKKEDFIAHYKVSEALLLSKLIAKQYSTLVDDAKKEYNIISSYIKRNLKRLGISMEQYEKLSENDRKILEKQFE